jgi:hypothetical protein
MALENMSAGPELRRQYEAARAAKARLWGHPLDSTDELPRDRLFQRPGERPGANLPRNGKTVFHAVERDAVDMDYAIDLICDDRQVTRYQLFQSKYSAAVAARHMLWAVLLDGGHAVSYIAKAFGVDHATVREGIAIFRAFQSGDA